MAMSYILCLNKLDPRIAPLLLQGVRDCADWAQQIHQLNTELKVQRYSWTQLHASMVETQAAVQVWDHEPCFGPLHVSFPRDLSSQAKEADIMVKDQELLVAKAEADSLRCLQSSKSDANRHLLDAKQREVQQLQAELDRRDEECSRLRDQLSKGLEGRVEIRAHVETSALGAVEVRMLNGLGRQEVRMFNGLGRQEGPARALRRGRSFSKEPIHGSRSCFHN